jgi:hypothetical protein
MPEAFNHFAAIVRSENLRAQWKAEKRSVFTCSGCLISLGAALCLLSGFAGFWWAVGLVLFGMGAMILAVWFSESRKAPRAAAVDWTQEFAAHPEGAGLLEELRFFEAQGRLDERTHPALIGLLERGARAVHEVANAPAGDAQIRAIKAAQGALVDCVWIGRGLFQRKGGRAATFQKRCADPAYGASALAAISAIIADVEALAAGLHGEAAGAGYDRAPLERTLRHIEELRRAEAELPSSVVEGWDEA